MSELYVFDVNQKARKAYELKFIFPGHPVPYTRMTQGSRWTQAAQNYLGYRNALADALRAEFPNLVIPPAPPTSDVKARKAYNEQQKRIHYELGVDVFLARDAGDWSNFYKAVEDALQCAGLVWNDKQITRCLGGDRRIDKENPRVEIVLWRVNG